MFAPKPPEPAFKAGGKQGGQPVQHLRVTELGGQMCPQQLRIQGVVGPFPLPFLAHRQPRLPGASTLERLDMTFPIAPHAQRDPGRPQAVIGRIVVAAVELPNLGRCGLVLLQQAERRQVATVLGLEPELEFGFRSHIGSCW